MLLHYLFSDSTTIFTVITAVLILLYYRSTKHWQPLTAPLPPSPKGWPLLGNIRPKKQPWVEFSKLGEKYGKGMAYSGF